MSPPVVAGVISLEDGLRLIAERARLMQSLPEGGAMAAIMADEQQVAAALAGAGAVSIAAINGPRNVVISGERAAVQESVRRLESAGFASRPLEVSHAFHSALLDPMLDAFENVASQVRMSVPKLELISNLTGREYDQTEPVGGLYWRRHARETVRFADGIQTLRHHGHTLFLEISPHASLSRAGRSSAIQGSDELWLPSLVRDAGNDSTMAENVAALYTRGVRIDWSRFHEGRGRRKVLLPTYPFQRERIPLPEQAAQVRALPVPSDNHPLLGSRLRSPGLTRTVFQSYFDASHPRFLSDHRTDGRLIVPVGVYLEMAAAAAARVWGDGTHEVRDVAIEEALVLDEGPRLVQVLITPGDSPSFEICSTSAPEGAESPWITHAKGILYRRAAAKEAETSRRPATKQHDPDAHYEILRSAGAEYGPAFRLLSEIRSGDGVATGTLRAAPPDHEFLLHPTSLDAALQLAGIAFSTLPEASGALYDLAQVSAYRVWRCAEGTLEACVTVRDYDRSTQAFTVDIVLAAGRSEVAHIEGLMVPRCDGAGKSFSQRAVHDSILLMEWQALRAPATSAELRAVDGLWLLFDDDGSWATALDGCFGENQSVLHVRLGKSYLSPDNGVAVVRPHEPEDLERLFQEIETRQPVAGVVHLWNLSDPMPGACADLPDLVRVLLRRRQEGAPRLTVVTRGAQAVTQDEAGVSVGQAASWGFVRTLILEEPALRATIVDLDPRTQVEPQLEALARHFQSIEPAHDQLALRAGVRYVPRLARRPGTLPDPHPVCLKPDATYLITGGLGALGLHTASWMADRGARPSPFLAARSPRPSQEAAQVISGLRAKGVDVLVEEVDVSKREALAAALQRCSTDNQPLRGSSTLPEP